MIRHNFDPMEGTVQDLVAFCEHQEHTEDHEDNAETVKSKMKAKEYKIPKKDGKPSGKWCEVCKMNNHSTSDCNHVKHLREEHEEKYQQQKCQRYSWSHKDDENKKSESTCHFTKEQINAMVDHAVEHQLKELSTGKHKHSEEQYAIDEKVKEKFEELQLSESEASSMTSNNTVEEINNVDSDSK